MNLISMLPYGSEKQLCSKPNDLVMALRTVFVTTSNSVANWSKVRLQHDLCQRRYFKLLYSIKYKKGIQLGTLLKLTGLIHVCAFLTIFINSSIPLELGFLVGV